MLDAGGVTAMNMFLEKFFPKVYARMQEDKRLRAAGLEANNPYCKLFDL